MPVSPNEAAHRAASDAEQIAWVDELDVQLGSIQRAELRERGLIGRGTYILLFNSAGELCVHRRTLSKAIYPGYWDVAAGGMVLADESYAESAARELEEELGVSGVPLQVTVGGTAFTLIPGVTMGTIVMVIRLELATTGQVLLEVRITLIASPEVSELSE